MDQSYRRIADNVYRYESSGGKFVTELSVNKAGFVTSYPDLWEVEASV
ncbi:MAG: putative glycolipid-binding domain-containing protein [Blastocatellia bacterium]